MSTRQALPRFKAGHFLGHLPEFRRAPIELLLRVAREHPELARVRLGAISPLVVSSPLLAREVLFDKEDAFVKSYGLSLFARPLLGLGLLTLEGADHRKRRRMLAPAFMPKRVASYAEEIGQRAERSARRIASQSELDMSAEAMQLTLEIVLKTLFDAEISSAADTVGQAAPAALGAMMESMTGGSIPLPPPLPTRANLRLRRAVQKLDTIVYGLIRDHRQGPANAHGSQADDMLSLLLAARDQDDGSSLSDRELRDEAMTMLLAGHETTANALTWTLYTLARMPELRAQLEAEVDHIDAPQLGVQHLPALPLTLQVIKEAMRLYPPVYINARRALRAVDIGGYHIPRGSVVVINIVGIQRRPEIYPDPERFDPERFSVEREKLLPKQAYLPFSAGPRICIGNHFALMEAQLILATWLRHVRFELREPEQRPEYEALFVLRPKGGLPLRVSPRQRQAAPPLERRPEPGAAVHALPNAQGVTAPPGQL